MNKQAHILESEEVHRLVDLALEEDQILSDITTLACDLGEKNAKATIIAKAVTVACGLPLIPLILQRGEKCGAINKLVPYSTVPEGHVLTKNHPWFTLEGKASDILKIERVLLNFLMRMCGIAKTTHSVTELIKGTSCKVLHTRKTAPGHRRTDIYACLVGGAYQHRISLGDAILVKENHLSSVKSYQTLFDGIEKHKKKAHFVEIEVTNLTELKMVLPFKPNRILLDNFSVEDCGKAVQLFGGDIPFEASGGIHLANAKKYAETGVDFISMGWITHSAPAADLSLLLEI